MGSFLADEAHLTRCGRFWRMIRFIFFSKAPNGPGEQLLKDIANGAKYQEHPGRSRYDFSLFWNTDGVQVFKTAVPLHCILPELPPLVCKKFQILTL